MMRIQPHEMSAEQRIGLDRALEALDVVTKINQAIDVQRQKAATAKETHEAAARALADNDAALALATSQSKAAPIEAKGRTLEAALSEASADVDRQLRFVSALSDRLASAESALDSEKVSVECLVMEHASEVISLLAERVAQAAAPMIDALRLLVVASGAAGSSVAGNFAEMVLPDVRDGGYLLFGLSMVAKVDGQTVKLHDIGDDPDSMEFVRVVGQPRDALRKLGAYKTRAQRLQAQAREEMNTRRGSASQRID